MNRPLTRNIGQKTKTTDNVKNYLRMIYIWGAEIEGPDNDGPAKLRGMTLTDLSLTDQVTGVDIDGPDIDGLRKQGWTLPNHN